MHKDLKHIKKSGFSTPTDYFSGVEDKVFSALKEKEVIGVKDSGYKAPEDYFKTVEDNVFKQLDSKRFSKVISLFSKKNVIYTTSVAAVVALLLTVFTPNDILTIDTIETTSIEYYLEGEELGVYEIASILTDKELNSSSMFIGADEEYIEGYLLDTIEIEDLLMD